MHYIIGTAGHIDHGKTSLVKALTGQDTDRLKEEKERGISIVLGFAHLDLPDGVRAGVVDVPGHERFIRNMLAGAHGMDLVLFTVAADDGVMPQTEEHLDVLHLLGVGRAIFAITKADRVSSSRIDEVNDQIVALVAGSSLEGSPAIPVSVVTGQGLDLLRDRIADMLRQEGAPRSDRRFRLPVDRAFVSTGHGLIVTGTAIAGEVHPGDSLRCLPGSELLRVRSVEVHNESVGLASRGQRVALNVTGPSRAVVARGDVLCDPAIAIVSTCFDAKLEIRPRALSRLKDHQKIRIHAGTAERLGKAIVLGSPAKSWPGALEAGETSYCQIVIAEPMQVLRGDRFIVRDETAQRTLGGGIVVHPVASRHKRSDPDLMEKLEAFERGDEAAFVRALVEDRGDFAVSLPEIAQLSNRSEDEVRVHLGASADVHVFAAAGDEQYALEAACRQVRASLLESLRGWHAAHPLLPGMDVEDGRAALGVQVPQKIFRMIVEELIAEGKLFRVGPVLALPDHRVEIPEGDRVLVERIKTLLARTPMTPPDAGQLAGELQVDRRRLGEILRVLERQRAIVSVAPDLYFLGDCVERVRDDLTRWLSSKGGMTAAEFRDQFKTSRKYAIPLLEYFDREGVTLRKGDVRTLRRSRETKGA